MKICSVGGCGLSSQDILMFDFPTSRILRKRWLDVINAERKIAHNDAICIHHFKVDDYDVVRGVTRLKAKVVPSVFGEAVLPGRNHDPSRKTGKETSKEEDTNKEEEANKKEAVKKEEEGSIKSTKYDNDNGNSYNDNDDLDNEKDDLDNEKDDLDNEAHNTVNKNGTEDNDGENIKETSSYANITDKDRDSGEESSKSVDKESKRKEISSSDKNLQENGNRTSSNHDTVNDNEDNHTVTDNDNHTVSDNDNETVRVNKNNKLVSKPKRVRKKWVPMRKDSRGNGKVDLSEDSSSQDSVNSDLPAPPVLEDLEEHLPNYQIANMKTERQVAAMTVTEDPVQESLIDQDIEEMVITPHVPVFIELAVGRDNQESTANNDCVMVVESVQCDVDPTLMLEARLEDEDCWEQIDIDDDDDEDVVMDTTPAVEEKKKTSKKKPPKKPKPCADPISLLTSSDEDDVIIQEPHIDTLSVSDETDEDDLPLQKLIKREKKNKKNKKTNKKPENLSEVFVGIKDFFCMHCGNISTNRSDHDNHIKTHKTERTPTRARIYEICKDCGFTSASKSQLNRHTRKHLNEKKYKCSLCTYRSKYSMSLLYHLKTHEDPNRYNCGSCGLKLAAKKQLVEHQKSCSEMDDKFMCSTCGFIARSKRDLKVHRSRVHKK